MRLRRELEDARMQGEQQSAANKKKQQEILADLGEQLDQANKARIR